MIFLSDDALKYIKRTYIKYCITLLVMGASLYTISKKVDEQEMEIINLTKKIKESSSKGD